MGLIHGTVELLMTYGALKRGVIHGAVKVGVINEDLEVMNTAGLQGAKHQALRPVVIQFIKPGKSVVWIFGYF